MNHPLKPCTAVGVLWGIGFHTVPILNFCLLLSSIFMSNVKRRHFNSSKMLWFNMEHFSPPPAHVLKVTSLDDTKDVWKRSRDFRRWGLA